MSLNCIKYTLGDIKAVFFSSSSSIKSNENNIGIYKI